MISIHAHLHQLIDSKMPKDKYASTLGFAGLLAGSLIVAFDAVALSPSLPVGFITELSGKKLILTITQIIENALHLNTIETYWASVAYTLGSATFLPLFPAISNAIGRRPVTTAALALFLIGVLVCATANNAASLLAGRALQGVGGGGIMAMLYVVMTDLFDLRQRAKALAINGMVWLVGLAIGPIMGGGFSANVTWRWYVLCYQ
jgi:MFS family permease